MPGTQGPAPHTAWALRTQVPPASSMDQDAGHWCQLLRAGEGSPLPGLIQALTGYSGQSGPSSDAPSLR